MGANTAHASSIAQAALSNAEVQRVVHRLFSSLFFPARKTKKRNWCPLEKATRSNPVTWKPKGNQDKPKSRPKRQQLGVSFLRGRSRMRVCRDEKLISCNWDPSFCLIVSETPHCPPGPSAKHPLSHASFRFRAAAGLLRGFHAAAPGAGGLCL